jgi:hypothetical protein
MQRIILTNAIQVDGDPHSIGDIITVECDEARYVLAGGHARLATAEDIAHSRNPQPAADVRRAIMGRGWQYR